jgi:hypothetical protein
MLPHKSHFYLSSRLNNQIFQLKKSVKKHSDLKRLTDVLIYLYDQNNKNKLFYLFFELPYDHCIAYKFTPLET